MATLKNRLHEKFAKLITQGESPTAAYRILVPDAKNHNTLGSRLWNRRDIRIRVSEINEEILVQTALSISQKRQILCDQILGLIPTKVSLLSDGSKVETYDMLGAIMLDSRLSGELDNPKNAQRGPTLKLDFSISRRESDLTAENMELGTLRSSSGKMTEEN
jgi:hypothetical protein